MAVYKTARFRVRDEGVEATLEAIAEFVDYIKASEPGTLQYTSVQQSDGTNGFLHFFTFEDKAAEERHASSDGVKRFTDVLYPLLDEDGVTFTEYGLVATT